jgi:hypothetical protein
MSIFDVFTGRSAKDAAAQNAALYEQYKRDATGQLQGAQTAGLGDLTTGLTSAGGALNTARTDIGGGVDAYGRAVEAYSPLSDLGAKYGKGTDLYMGALGVNGAAGTAAARDAFTTSPGYAFTRDEATNAAQRSINRFQPGGNEADAIARLTSGLASKEYAGWLDRLGGFVSPELAATSGAAQGRAAGFAGQAGQYGKLADIEGARAGTYTQDALARLGLRRGTATDISNVYGNAASGLAGSNTSAANAQMAGSGNFWNALINAAGSVAGGYVGGGKKT